MHIQQFMPRELRPDRNIAVGDRLKLVRLALGYDDKGGQGRFAEDAGLKPNRYNQWETGERYPPAASLVQLCLKFAGLTMDYVYLGKIDGMPLWLTKKLQQVADHDISSASTPPALATPPARVPKATKIVKLPAQKRRRA